MRTSSLTGHVLESLAALPWVGSTGTLLDVGSGNGFPAVPLLLARPGVRGVLLEPRERRWAFLREVVRELGLPAEVRARAAGEHRGDWLRRWPRCAGSRPRRGWPTRCVSCDADGTWLWWTSTANAAELGRRCRRGV